MALRRYGGAWDAFMALPAGIGVDLLEKARLDERDAPVREEWVALLPYMKMGWIRLHQWEDYRDQRLGLNVDTRPTGAIIAELEKLHGGRLL